MNITHMKQGDNLPDYTATLQTGSGSTAAPIDITDTNILFLMRYTGTRTVKVSGAASTVGDPTLGNVKYSWGDADLDTAGDFDVEWEITYPNTGKKLTVPSSGYDTIRVLDDIA